MRYIHITGSLRDIPGVIAFGGWVIERIGKKMTEDQAKTAFHLEEFKSLRAEIQYRVQEQMAILRHSILGSAAVYSFLFGVLSVKTAEGVAADIDPRFENLMAFLWLIPVAFSILGAIRWWDNDATIMTIAGYIEQYEKRIDAKDKGWETHIKSMRRSDEKIDRTAHALWLIFSSLTVIVAVYWWIRSGFIIIVLGMIVLLALVGGFWLSAKGRALAGRLRKSLNVDRPQ
jgi:hypothetical protein